MGYRIGTVNVVSGSTKVIGVGTEWADLKNGVMPGFPFKGPNGLIYEIKSIESNTGMTLNEAYTGPTASGQSYSILTTYQGDLSQFAAQFNALLTYYRLTRNQMMSVLTGTEEVQVTSDDGSIITVRSLQEMNAVLNGKVTGVKQTGPFDATAGSLLINGAWGWGGLGQTFNSDDAALLVSARNAAFGSRVFRNDTVSAYSKQYAPSLMLKTGDTWAIVSVGYTVSGVSGGIRIAAGTNSGSATTVHELWTDKNLTPSDMYGSRGTLGTADLDTIFGPNYRGVWDQGSTANATVARNYPINSAGSLEVIYNAANGVGVIQRYTTHASNRVFVRYKARDLPGDTWSAWVEQWTSGNLVKQSQYVSTSGDVLISGLAGGIGRDSSQTVPDATLASNFRANGAWYVRSSQQSDVPANGYLYNIFGNPSNTYGSQLFIGPNNATPSFQYRTIEGNAVGNWHELATLDTAQTFTGQKTFSASMNVATGSATGGLEIGSLSAAGNSFIDFHTSGNNNDYDVRILAGGGAAAIGQGTMNINAANLQWNGNAVIDAATAQTIAGAKVFTAYPEVRGSTPVFRLQATAIAESIVGRHIEVANIAGVPRLYLKAGSGGSPISAGEKVISFPTTATGTVLVTGNNAVVDSNGFWKTASPVVKLFADGTSELTSEAEGITTERLSEGVYRIAGCLGLNADRAWGGDDGGIDVPMCRNKLPRLWVDYGGDEGSAQINPDGSIVIRTYHRPHPDAPVFARNEIEGYANGDPIDIPHDTFISVRVQMPAVEAQEAVVETVPNAVESDVVLETSTPV
ncbi:pyocin knob domain-containing protein [Candidatus Symbiopectobacterium sp. NZEC135]|uniref:pyocin knob domain-containing protein n=1 Tax=Candidatus Symbiopectobacterium sp. NZEC135 TaxID=2820471 RepID=UPI00222747DB|nr:pyocin knob domain-containing protein [Candidatus Symbiopectobacterium sp. NZEC135]MCW2480349.1 hypothetical protein [Candidatus Symbiopectobacterium sp. NZEC135]